MQAKLLIVEDEEHVRASLQEYFEREGFDVDVPTTRGPSADKAMAEGPRCVRCGVALAAGMPSA